MDYRNIPTFPGHRPWLCGRCRVPVRERGCQGRARASSVALYLLAAAILGLPLAFPELARVWVIVNSVLALLVASLIAATQRRADPVLCPRCGLERPADASVRAAVRPNL